jgi:site-specific recombinase XerD
MLTGLAHGLRISELLAIRGTDISKGYLTVKRLKGSKKTCQPIVRSDDVLFDCSSILELAKTKGDGVLFNWSRQYMDVLFKKYGSMAGIHPNKCHSHAAMKHSLAMSLWSETHSVGDIQNYLGHRAASSTMCYLYEANAEKVQNAVANIKW